MNRSRVVIAFLVVLMTFVTLTSAAIIDDYMNLSSPAMNYTLEATTTLDVGVLYTLSIRGVDWLTSEEVGSSSSWKHYLAIVVPFNLNTNYNESFLYIEGGSSSTAKPTSNDMLKALAYYTNTIASQVYIVPNQPITFNSDPSKSARSEDSLIAYTWNSFMDKYENKSGNVDVKTYEWLGHLPMAKTSVRAMDAVQDFVYKLNGVSIKKFTVSGGSKRGWAAWLVGAADSRVKSLIPLSIQVLNLKESFLQINKSLCAWPIALYDYSSQGVLKRVDSAAFSALQAVEDPLAYKERYSNFAIYMINALGDEFMWPDLALKSWPYMTNINKKYLRYIPNTGHGLTNSDAVDSVLLFYYMQIKGIEAPQYNFTHTYTDTGVKITVWSSMKPTSVNLWRANNTNARDFRITTIGSTYKSSNVSESQDPNVWQVFVPNPAQGYAALSVELVFENFVNGLKPLRLTTSGYIIPNTYPCDVITPTPTNNSTNNGTTPIVYKSTSKTVMKSTKVNGAVIASSLTIGSIISMMLMLLFSL